ncbi:MAG: barstar family protein [Sulfuricurvum sp.]
MNHLFTSDYKPFATTTLSFEAMRLMVEVENLALFDVKGENLTTKENLIHALAQAGGFYDPFPTNWDALADALCDLPTEKKGVLWVFPPLHLSDTDTTIVKEIFAEAANFWSTQGQRFWVYVKETTPLS